MPGVIVDGNDVIDVYRAASQAAERAREGEGPTLIECKTYRWRGHHEGDPDLGIRYRTKEEIEEWKEKCPIKRLTTQLIDNGHITEKQLQEIDDQILSDIQDAIAFAEQSEFPQASELYEDIYVNN
jgi:pyruvate dehydrogenase E1 component alpha subunit